MSSLAESGTNISAKPVQRRLMIPLAVSLLVLVGIFGAVMVAQRKERLNQSSLQVMTQVSNNFAQLLVEQSRSLSAIEDTLIQNVDLKEALRARDRISDFVAVVCKNPRK